MGFKSSEETDEVFNRYIEMAEEGSKIDITETNKMLERAALKMYKVLLEKRVL
jgi:hypothetical protein